MTTKPEDQIEKDKEAVQKMVGAKSAMEAAIRRVQVLESALKIARAGFEEIGRGHGDSLAIKVCRNGNPVFVSAKELMRKAINDIDDAL